MGRGNLPGADTENVGNRAIVALYQSGAMRLRRLPYDQLSW